MFDRRRSSSILSFRGAYVCTERLLLMIIIIRLIISTYLNSGSKRPSRSRGTIASTVSFLLLRLPTLACLLFGPLPLVTYLYIAFPRSLDSLFLKRFLQIWSREHTHLPFTTIRTSPQPPPTLPSIPYQYYYSYYSTHHGCRQFDFPTWA